MGPELWSVYDQMGERYARKSESDAYNAHYDRPAVLDALGPVRGLHVLDAACGPGVYAEVLLAAGARVTGFDASGAMLDLAARRLGAAARLDRAVLGEPLPYPSAEFDAAVCALAVHCVADQSAAFQELHRVVRPGGVLVVSTHHPTADWLLAGGCYFDTVLTSMTWHLPDGDRQVTFWRRPLSAVCAAATDAGWLIERLVEPRPAESMQEPFPEDYARLQREPGFLILRLRKPGTG